MTFRRKLSPFLVVLVAAVLLVLGVVALERGAAEDPAVSAGPSSVEAVASSPEGSVDRSAQTAAEGNQLLPDEPRALGLAGGYVDDQTCARCHGDLYRSYQAVGMAQAFYRPGAREAIEDFENTGFYHSPSRRHYEIRRSGDELVMRRYQLAEDGQPINELEQKVDWILGSGHTSRSYLYQTEWGELYQLPVAWYTQSQSWAMAPGFDNEDHQGTLRRTRRECMFCHNGYPDVAAGTDDYGDPQTYPHELPQGLGCQRCHGPGKEHVEAVIAGEEDAAVRAAVLNPSRLSPGRSLEVCLQCHFQPSVALSGVRRFGRGDYSYRPGEPLSDYVAPLDVVEDRPQEERFEINHHPYRMFQSPCYLETMEAGQPQLTCLSCHDPHHKVPAAGRAEHYRQACLNCHQVEQCGAQEAGGPRPAGSEDIALDNCVGCHMPRRRTEDVVGVVMTDHRIGLPPPDLEALVEPLEERSRVVHGIEFVFPEAKGSEAEAEVYRAVAMVRGGSMTSLGRLEKALAAAQTTAPEPYLDLAQGQLQAGRVGDAVATLQRVVDAHPELAVAHLRLGVALASGRKLEAGREHLRRSLELEPESPEALYNLGKTEMVQQRFPAAEELFRQALDLRPNLVEARFDLGVALALQGQLEASAEEFRRTLALDPRHGKAYLNLGQALLQLGRVEEARRYWRHGVGEVEDPSSLRDALQRLDAAGAR